MKEYAVMVIVGDSEPEFYSGPYESEDSAQKDCSRAWDRMDEERREGISVRSYEEATAAANRLRSLKTTVYEVAEREVSPWRFLPGC